jgi:hypothetical protein
MNRQNHLHATRRGVALLAASLLAVAAIAVVLDRDGSGAALPPVTGGFTGEIATGGPVYRLPTVHVVADRKTELASVEREEQRERAREARAKRVAGADG